ncbi:MAG: hypothetical protein B7733_06250 [Myxococcales bacterium FL481]|nr:MAG: hypothetical protein B7733_06250 [Myxococcales bacterium FL481]
MGDDWVSRFMDWKERAKWGIRHAPDHEIVNLLQEGVNLGHDLERDAVEALLLAYARAREENDA